VKKTVALPNLILLANPIEVPKRQKVTSFGMIAKNDQEKRERRKAMSLKPQPISPVPEETARIARAAYPKGSRPRMV
jgi:hypothetical protein